MTSDDQNVPVCGLAVVPCSVLQNAGQGIELPAPGAPGLNPPVKRGDEIRTLCRVVGEGNPGWLCGPYTVIYLCGDKPVYRPRYAKVDKVANEWILSSPNAEGQPPKVG